MVIVLQAIMKKEVSDQPKSRCKRVRVHRASLAACQVMGILISGSAFGKKFVSLPIGNGQGEIGLAGSG
jgi:hypothetical protein